jgi:GT2 family glycosyltransferase
MSDLVSVIILNWNGKEFIRGCLESVLSQDYPEMEVIVVDNGSEDESVIIVRERFPQVTVIETGCNLGFDKGNNIGIRRARGDYICVLNNDAEMDRSCISEMKKALEKERTFGACASKIYLKYEKDLLDAAGIVVCPDGLAIGRGRLEDGSLYDAESEVFFASGCCALYRREMLEDVRVGDEYFDEDFFAYADDSDLGWRARLRGWRCIYNPRAKVYHLHSATTGGYSPMKAYLVERNRIWLSVKCFPLPMLFYGLGFTIKRYAYQAYGAIFGRGASGAFARERSRGELVSILFKVYRDAIRGLPRVMRKRRAIQKRRVISTGDIFSLVNAYGIGAREIGLKG